MPRKSNTRLKKGNAKLKQDQKKGVARIEKGLGDVIEEVTEKTGVKKVVKKIFGDNCGCEERKEKINQNKKLKLSRRIVGCFKEGELESFEAFQNKNSQLVSNEERNMIRQIYISLFDRDIQKPSCCLDKYINDIEKVRQTYYL